MNTIINQCPICGCKETDPDADQMKLEFEKQDENTNPVQRNLPCEMCERKLRNIFQAKYFFRSQNYRAGGRFMELYQALKGGD